MDKHPHPRLDPFWIVWVTIVILLVLIVSGCQASSSITRTLWPARNQLVVPVAPIAHATADDLDVSKPSPLVIRSEVRTRFVAPKGEK